MPKRILIVDDAMFMRAMLRRILEDAGFEIAGEAENGEIAVHKYRDIKPDVVLMDITMPEMDGISALKSILRHDSDAKVIMCTALSQKNMVMEALESGALDYLIKPFNPAQIIDALSRIDLQEAA